DRSSGGNIALDLESVIVDVRSADRFGVVLAHGGALAPKDLCGGDARIADLPVVRNAAFYLDSERADIFGEALLQPDVLLEELSCVFHPGKCKVMDTRYVLRPVQP
ncbi:MAG TPA: hypothetical protein PK760_06490, partial [Flavobacteriales bacterium]|nr:hypothetical protein [Flavobacteriales bacterium]